MRSPVVVAALLAIVAWGGCVGGYLYARQGCQATADLLEACQRRRLPDLPAPEPARVVPFVGPPDFSSYQPTFECFAAVRGPGRCCFRSYVDDTWGMVSWAPIGCFP